MEKIYAYAFILDAAYRADRRYLYFIPEELRAEIQTGSLCIVPFGNSNRRRTAVVVDFCAETDYAQIKPIDEILPYPVRCTDEMLKTAMFMKERFFCTFGQALKVILPPGLGMKSRNFYSMLPYDAERLNQKSRYLLEYISVSGRTEEKDILAQFGEEVKPLLATLTKLGAICRESEVLKNVNEKTFFLYSLAPSVSPDELPPLKSEKQKRIVDFLRDGASLTAIEGMELFDAGVSVFNTLVKNGILVKTEKRTDRSFLPEGEIQPKREYILNEEQQQACETIASLLETGEPHAALLYGVTGSGKTRVIIESCRKAIASGKGALVLLPEIGLTAQAIGIYRAAFGDKLAVIHSMLSSGERLDAFRRISEGKADIVIGTRSAVFAPFPKLGIIVIDEEQEHTYQSESDPKYHARDIARFRCAYHQSLLLLCSATPSVESRYKAEKGIYTIIRLTGRFGGTELPECALADLRNDPSLTEGHILGTQLRKTMQEVLERKEQVILFAPRRGYHTHLSCMQCGTVFYCPNCSVALTYHALGDSAHANKLVCHYCGYVSRVPQECPSCGSKHLAYHGFGTQKLGDELSELFPQAKAIRMDADTTSDKHAHETILSAFGAGEYDILYGTQMVAKGLDFPRVSLVGVLSADAPLYCNDFRAGERAFSLFTQLAGRSGRGEKRGRALIQTYNPDNEILKLACRQDVDSFYQSEILLRKAVLFPPFCDLAVFTFLADTAEDADRASALMGELLTRLYTEKYPTLPVVKLGPFPDGAYKRRNRFHQRILLKYRDKTESRRFLGEVYELFQRKLPPTVRVDLSVNPAMV